MLTHIRKYLRRKVDPVELLHRLAPADLPLKSVIHVGAHLAQERHDYERLGYEQVLWIEGSPRVYEGLVQIIQDHPATAQHFTRCALLTDQDGAEVALREFSNGGMSNSIFSPTDSLRARWPQVDETGSAQAMITSTLDTLVEGTPFEEHCDLLVVDVQGAEKLVLQGAPRTLAQAVAVVAEVSTVPYYQGGVLFDELASLLDAHGFVPMAIPRRHGDMLFLRREIAQRAAA